MLTFIAIVLILLLAAGVGFGVGFSSRHWILGALAAAPLVLLALAFAPLIGFFSDMAWYQSIGFESVYVRRFSAPLQMFALFALIAYLWLAANAFFALRTLIVGYTSMAMDSHPNRYNHAKSARTDAEAEQDPKESDASSTTRLLVLAGTLLIPILPAAIIGLFASGAWETFLLAQNATSFGIVEPVFGNDVSFYVFTLPWLGFLHSFSGLLLAIAFVGMGAVAFLRNEHAENINEFDFVGSRQLTFLAGLGFVWLGLAQKLSAFDALTSDHNVLSGVNYVAEHVTIPVAGFLAVVAFIFAAVTFGGAAFRKWWVPVASFSVWILLAFITTFAYPTFVQHVSVDPDQQNTELPYILRHITATRAAFKLDTVELSNFSATEAPTAAEVAADAETIANIRLQDWRPLTKAAQQLQGVRQYYVFNDIDVTHFPTADGGSRELMIAARELDSNKTPDQWVSRHLKYTHGYGAIAAQVSAVTPEGFPLFTLKNLPPVGEPTVTRPQIYFGERTSEWVIVDTKTEEFDYPQDAVDHTAAYTGSGGVSLSGWNKFLFTMRFNDPNIWISNQLTDASRVLFHRNIAERARALMPRLSYDGDPYLVIADGKLFWMQDAYTQTDKYPYATNVEGARYIRASVKVLTDAYTGEVIFYAVEQNEPILRTLAAVYPNVFKPFSEMAPAVRAQVRYPEGFFKMQVAAYARYHVTDPSIFYAQQDNWQIAREILDQGKAPVHIEPYYVETRLPGQEHPEFVLFVPFTPASRDNMVGWLAGRSDGEHYGQLRALRFPSEANIFGPLQVEGRIDSDTVIKPQLQLLSNGANGSTVYRGNTLVIPIGSSFLYVEPIFVQSASTNLPELRKVVLATQNRVVMEDTLPKALATLFGSGTGTSPNPGTPPGASNTPSTPSTPSGTAPRTPGATPNPASRDLSPAAQALILSASAHYGLANEALARKDFTTYGNELKAMEADLAALRALAGITLP